jgi:hypothetical protein
MMHYVYAYCQQYLAEHTDGHVGNEDSGQMCIECQVILIDDGVVLAPRLLLQQQINT